MPVTASQAVFLSYASQDASAARAICEALRRAGVEVWFDQNELVGGDAWDAKIRRQITTCALFVPIISAATQARDEGYFRLEWKLAVDRSHLMAHDRTFLLPVVIDATPDTSARVPPEFRAVQWTRLPDGATPPAFVERVHALLGGKSAVDAPAVAPTAAPRSAAAGASEMPPSRRSRLPWLVAAGTLAGLAVLSWKFLPTAGDSGGTQPKAPPSVATTAPKPTALDPRRIAVLPLDNFSADAKDEYLADGLTEELNSCLSRISRLEVIARTSSARAKRSGKSVPEIGAELRAGTLLEGSVRKAGDQLRITVKLIDVKSQRQLWAQDYNTVFNQDVFKMQSDIAERVAAALQIKLLGSEVQRLRKEPTSNFAAYQLYLQGIFYGLKYTEENTLRARECYQQAVALDPNFALAYCGIAYTPDPRLPPRATWPEVEKAARKAIELDDMLAEAHLTMGMYKLEGEWNWSAAEASFKRALELQPSSAIAHGAYAGFLVSMSRFDAAIAAAKTAVELDPTSPTMRKGLCFILGFSRRFEECAEVAQKVLKTEPDDPFALAWLGWAYALQKKLPEAVAAFQKAAAIERNPFMIWSLGCCDAMAGRTEAARRALAELETLSATRYVSPKFPAALLLLLGEKGKALTLLEKCVVERDSICIQFQVDPLWDPLRQEPRFQELIRKLAFPP